MKASEVRIGNFVKLGVANDPYVIMSIDESGCLIGPLNKLEFPDGEFFTNIEPIPLTEEWLVKFGFNEHHDCFFLDLITGLYIIYSKKRKGFVYEVNGMDVDCSIKYVHQLQNLYFALTGEELLPKNSKILKTK